MKAPAESHLSAEEIAAYLSRDVSRAEREEIERHFAGCGRCCDELVAVGGVLPEPRGTARHVATGVVIVAILAVGVLAIGSDLFVRSEGPALRAEEEAAQVLTPPIRTLVPADGGIVVADELRFGWRPVSEDALYHLTLTDVNGTPIWGETTRDTLLTLPRDVVLRAGERYYWYVDALMADGATASTGVRRFTVR